MKDRFAFKKTLFAKSLYRLGEIAFGGGLLSIWFVPKAPTPLKIGVVIFFLLAYVSAFVFSPWETAKGENGNGD